MTGRPLVMLGIVTAPPEPVYFVMLIVPLLVVKLNWACTVAGSAKNSRNRGDFAAWMILAIKVVGFMLQPFSVVCLLPDRRWVVAACGLGQTILIRPYAANLRLSVGRVNSKSECINLYFNIN